MFQRLWLFRVPVGRIVLILFAGIALIAATISGFGWFIAKSSAVTTGATPTEPENLPTTLVLSDSQVASLKIETLGTHRFRIEKDCIGSTRRRCFRRSAVVGGTARIFRRRAIKQPAWRQIARYLHDRGLGTLPNGNVIESFYLGSLMPS